MLEPTHPSAIEIHFSNAVCPLTLTSKLDLRKFASAIQAIPTELLLLLPLSPEPYKAKQAMRV